MKIERIDFNKSPRFRPGMDTGRNNSVCQRYMIYREDGNEFFIVHYKKIGVGICVPVEPMNLVCTMSREKDQISKRVIGYNRSGVEFSRFKGYYSVDTTRKLYSFIDPTSLLFRVDSSIWKHTHVSALVYIEDALIEGTIY